MTNQCIERADGVIYKFDGQLVSANGQTIVIDCRVSPPLVGGDSAIIELSVPNALMPVPAIHNPCSISGQLGGVTIWLDDVWYRYMPSDQQPRREAGLSPIVLTHVGKLKIIMSPNMMNETVQAVAPRSIKFHLTSNAFLSDNAWQSKLSKTANCQSDELYTVDIPQLGNVRFLREWVFARSSIPENAIVKSGFCAVIELVEETTQTIEKYISHFEDALMVISVFCRQRIDVLGWEVKYNDDRCEQIWDAPLDPISTKYMPYEPDDYLIEKNHFSSFVGVATSKFIGIDPVKKEIIKHMSIGLAPFVSMRDSERFLTMFHALEACRTLAPELEIKNDDVELMKILESSKQGVNDKIAERIEGFIKNIASNKPSLRFQLESVFADWQIKSDDLWPLKGNEKLPGLIDLRDKITHIGPKTLHAQGLAVATWHLSIFLERVILSQLNIPITESAAATVRLKREKWYQPEYLLEQRRMLIKKWARSK